MSFAVFDDLLLLVPYANHLLRTENDVLMAFDTFLPYYQ